MKRALLLSATLSLFGCDSVCVDGTGDVVSEARTVDGYDKVVLETSGRVELTQRDSFDFSMTGDANLLRRLEIFVRSSALHIRDKNGRCLSPTDDLVYEVAMPVVRRAAVSGDGAISSVGVVNAPELGLDVSGSGDLDIELAGGEVSTSISGSGEVALRGSATHHALAISGSGNFAGFELETAVTDAEISGSGNAQVNATQRLDVDISGSGRLRYKGSPEVSTQIAGSGSVRAAN